MSKPTSRQKWFLNAAAQEIAITFAVHAQQRPQLLNRKRDARSPGALTRSRESAIRQKQLLDATAAAAINHKILTKEP